MAATNKLGLKSAEIVSDFSNEGAGATVGIQGPEKSGKNHLAFTAPKPLLCIAGDRNPRPVARKFEDIHVAFFHYDYDPTKGAVQANADAARPVWKQVEKLYYEALRSPKVRSIVMDTATWAWDTVRLAKFGKLQQVPPVLYTQVNAVFERMILAAQGTGKHVIWLSREGDLWIDVKEDGKYVSKNTGQIKRLGFKGLGFDMEANIQVSRVGSDFTATVLDNGFDPELNGMEFKKKMFNYETILGSMMETL